jgi:N12 class adenine-specific DNA methylase
VRGLAGREATRDEQGVLARWSGWGAVPAVFDAGAASYDKYAWAREELRGLLSDDEWAAAARNTLNAHYTDAGYAQAVWDAMRGLGFQNGRVLEPGCGSGNFIGCAPEGAELVGIELEPSTASIAQALYPHATIRPESFAETDAPSGSFDLAIGNVPFGSFSLHDARHNRAGHTIHNHFILKSLHLTRPGGFVAVLTSRYTLDTANPAARREMAELADLVGAVRLPTGAHRRAAGTDVVTDVLIFRRREAERAPAGAVFERSNPVELAAESRLAQRLEAAGADKLVRMNEYFAAHPEHVLGQLVLDQGDRGRAELGVRGDGDTAAALSRTLTSIVAKARDQDLVFSEASVSQVPLTVARVGDSKLMEGRIEALPDGTFTIVEQGSVVPHKPPASQAGELRQLVALRDTQVALLELEAANPDVTPEMVALRAKLNAVYDGYVREFGPLNRYTLRSTGRIDPETGEEGQARKKPPLGGFSKDPFAPAVFALEAFDDETQVARKAAIFSDRVVAKREPRLGADTPADALAICLDTVGEVRLPEIARLLGVSEDEARRGLGTLVFDEPGADRLVPAAEYLSGNVRIKLEAARGAAAEDPRFTANVTALTAVQPRDLAPDEIDAQLGAAWIDAEYVRDFLAEILDDRRVRVEHPGAAIWAVKAGYTSILATTQWGTERVSAYDIAESLLEQRQIRIYDTDSEGNRIFNPVATTAATEKAAELQARFAEWVWEEPERAARLARTYNDQFNAIVPRSYDGTSLTLPGLALSFRPREHQVAAVARIIQEPAVGLFHEVGAGKTAEMVIGAMELRRLGLARKPVVVVPNHMLDQFTREWLQLYPQAKLLAASSEDLGKDRRMRFAAKATTGDWDGIIMTRSAFERLAMSPAAQARYIEREVEALTNMLESAKESGSRLTLKRMERLKVQAEERLKAKLDSDKDPGLTFEQTGIDYIFADEAHAYKNLRTSSHIQGMSVDGSNRASDLDMKLGYLRESGKRVATLATATPIANSMGEAFTMQRYLRPDLLAQAGVQDFDVWAATFGSLSSAIEVSPDGGAMRMKTRFAKFKNVPELLQLWRVSSDIKTAEDLALPVPPMAVRESDGARAPVTVVVPPSEELRAYVLDLAKRADAVRNGMVDPTEDNLLKISSDGRQAGLDLRLRGLSTESSQKVDYVVDRIVKVYEAHKNDRFPVPDVRDETHPTPGALQLVFADLGTPNADHWNVYDELRKQLVARGLPAGSIRFMHEAKNDREKGELFAACRDGRVSVLIGSTERMGVGTNVQLRAVALHHVDCPWRPADVAQREGRILRQGNACPEVQLFRYVTEGSFDAYMWQTVTRKAQFIAQVMRGRLDVREIDDVGEAALSYNEVKALATGNPLLLEHAKAEAEVTRLERLERSYERSLDTLAWTISSLEKKSAWADERVGALTSAIAARDATPVEPFVMTIQGRPCHEKDAANAVLRSLLTSQLSRYGAPEGDLGRLRGLGIHVSTTRDGNGQPRGVEIRLGNLPEATVEVLAGDIAKANIVTRLENKLGGLEAARTNAETDGKRFVVEAQRATEERAKPFRHTEALDEARKRLKVLDEEMLKAATPAQPEAGPVEKQLYEVLEAKARARQPDIGEATLADEMAAARRDLHELSAKTGRLVEDVAVDVLARVEGRAPEVLERLEGRASPASPAEPEPGPAEARLYQVLEDQARRAAVTGGRPVDTEQLAQALDKACQDLHAISARTGQPAETLATLALERIEREHGGPERAPSRAMPGPMER